MWMPLTLNTIILALGENALIFYQNSFNLFLKEMYRDQFGEFVCGYLGLKG